MSDESEIDFDYMGALEPYFELVQNEYNRERDRKQSLETRSGLIITVITALFAFFVNKISIKEILEIFQCPLSFLSLLKILSGIAVYISLLVCTWFSLKTITTMQYSYFDISVITLEKLRNPKNYEMIDIVNKYKNMLLNNIKINDKKASFLDFSIKSIIVCVLSSVIYISVL